MNRWMLAPAVLCAAIGCASGPARTLQPSPPEAFAGEWRSVTPSLEFIRLSVASKSSQAGVLGARLTLSGVAWEGGGRIDADSLVTSVAIIGSTTPTGVLVARPVDAKTLRVQMRSASGPNLDLVFVRED